MALKIYNSFTKQKEEFIQTFDWNMMTTQDEDVWQEIINWLNS